MKYIQLHTKEEFNEVMRLHKKDWGDWMWDYFQNRTCYFPEENYFCNLEKAEKL